jgi:hypothetical protein
MLDKLPLVISYSFIIFTLFMIPHILYMLTYDVVYFINTSGDLVSYVDAVGFPYPMISIILFSISSVILGTKLALNKNISK